MTDQSHPSYLLSESVEKLPNLLGIALVQMGKVFRDSARRDQKALDRHKAVLHQLIPQINRRHHDTLDEVEIELLKAKSVMERDLAVIRAKRAERERAANAAKGISSRQPSAKPDDSSQDVKPLVFDVVEVEEKPSDDVLMLDDDGTAPTAILPNGKTAENRGTDSNSMDIVAGSPSNVTASLVELTGDISQSSPDNKFTTLMQSQSLEHVPNANFDSMFADPTATDDINFDIDFSTPLPNPTDLPNAPANDLTAPNFDDLTNAADGFGNINASTNEDISTLLPGLENYVDVDTDAGAVADFDLFDLGGDSAFEVQGNGTARLAGSDLTQGIQGTGQVQSTFDDLFGDGIGDDGMEGTVGLSDFDAFDDDDFFNN